MPDYDHWLGQERVTCSSMDAWPAQALRALLGGNPSADMELPALWHWLYFLETPRPSEQGRDGHPRKGDFLPPIPQPRRMFVGGRSRVHVPLQLGKPAELRETIKHCETKQGSAGAMTLLTVSYCYRQGQQLCIDEERDFMYLAEREPGFLPEGLTEQQAPVPASALECDLSTDPVQLFRFSALTYNGHRIHYDSEYARTVEGYPERVVHGPLTALLLAEMASAAGDLKTFSFRAKRPLYCGDRLRLRGQQDDQGIHLQAFRPDGQIAMTAEATP